MEEVKEEKKAEKKFRFANQYAMLTYPTHLEKQMLRAHFKQEFKVAVIEIAHEIGETGYQHTHCVVNFGKAFQSRNSRVFDIGNLHPNILTFKNYEWKIKLNYIAKQDPENAHLKEGVEKPIAVTIWESKSYEDALLLAKRPGEATGIKLIWEAKPKEKRIRKEFVFRPWQKEIFDILQKKPNNRSIMWIRDLIGGAGKSEFTKWMHEEKHGLLLRQFGKLSDISSTIAAAVEGDWNQRIVMADLPRKFEEREVYTALEYIKDGSVTTSKWVGKTVTFDSPHVLVTANFWPDLTSMSLDRWILFDLSYDKQTETYNIKKVSVFDLLKELGQGLELAAAVKTT